MRMMKTFSLYFASATLITTFFVGISLLSIVDGYWPEILFKTTILMIPSGIFILATSVLFGALTGWIIGAIVHQKSEEVAGKLLEIEQGNFNFDLQNLKTRDDFLTIWQRIDSLSNRFKEQTKVYQKLVNERVEWNSQKKEEVLTEERNRLARELHDSVSQQLFAATMLLSAINQNPDPTSETVVKQRKLVEEIINEAQSEMRALLLHLRPIQLEGKSLKTGIEEMLAELTARLPLKVVWNIQDVALEKGVEDHLFRIIQEAVSNTLRHAKANLLEVTLKQINDILYLKITDNGRGFDLNKIKTGSYGLTNMKERAAEIGGSLKMISISGQGSSIEVKVPILMQKKDELND